MKISSDDLNYFMRTEIDRLENNAHVMFDEQYKIFKRDLNDNNIGYEVSKKEGVICFSFFVR